jgi:hypothetical protein
MKPGWKTTEFWLTALSGAPALLVAAGLIPISDQQTVSAYISKIVSGLIATVALAKYIHGRALVKSTLPALLLALLLPGLASAQHLLPWRSSVHQRLLALENAQKQAPQPAPAPQVIPVPVPQQQPQPQLIVLGGPQQQIPLGGPPLQNIPLGGPPRQDIPLGGPPRQDIPLGGPPQQQIPLGPEPKQQIPLGPAAPQQQIPLGPAVPAPAPPAGPGAPAAPGGGATPAKPAYQRFTVIPCLHVRH